MMMRNTILVLFVFVWNLGLAQCDTAFIFSKDSTNAVCIDTSVNVITIYTNGYPNHPWGSWPSNSPVLASDFTYNVCAYPQKAITPQSIYRNPNAINGCGGYIQVGVGLNGVFYSGWGARYFVNPNTQEENRDFNLEPLELFNMGFNNAHSNGNGTYHYHGVPEVYYNDSLKINNAAHSPLIGYAADGFPMYYKYAYSDPNDYNSPIDSFSSGYTLKSGNRPGDGITAPDGAYDGSYVEDYEYTRTNGPLDDCNGRFGKTPEYPNGTYYYLITDNWPHIPRCFYGTYIDNSFKIGQRCPPSTAAIDCSNPSNTTIGYIDEIPIKIFPNPTTGILSFGPSNNSLIKSISIYDVSGRILYSSSTKTNHIDISNFSTGTYYVQINTEQSEITRQLIKR